MLDEAGGLVTRHFVNYESADIGWILDLTSRAAVTGQGIAVVAPFSGIQLPVSAYSCARWTFTPRRAIPKKTTVVLVDLAHAE